MSAVGTKITIPRSIFANKLAQLNTAAKEEIYEVANMTTNKHVESQVHVSNTETEATAMSIPDMDHVANQLEEDICYHFKWAVAVQERIVHPLDQIWSLVEGNWRSAAQENHPTACNTFWTSKNALCEPYIRSNSVNGFWRHFHHWDFWSAIYRRCESCISISKSSQLQLTDAQTQWLVYWSRLDGGDTVWSCPSRLLQFLTLK